MRLYLACPSAAGGIGGTPKPGAPQRVSPLPGWMQIHPAFASVRSVTCRSPAEAASPKDWGCADDWLDSPPPAGTAVGADGDAQAPSASPPHAANTVHPRFNRFVMVALDDLCNRVVAFPCYRRKRAGEAATCREYSFPIGTAAGGVHGAG